MHLTKRTVLFASILFGRTKSLLEFQNVAISSTNRAVSNGLIRKDNKLSRDARIATLYLMIRSFFFRKVINRSHDLLESIFMKLMIRPLLFQSRLQMHFSMTALVSHCINNRSLQRTQIILNVFFEDLFHLIVTHLI